MPLVVVDDDPSLRGRTLHDVPIAGTVADLDRLVKAHRVQQIILAIAAPPVSLTQHVADVAEANEIPVRVVQVLSPLAHGVTHRVDLRDLKIEDLLGREQVQIDAQPLRRLLQGRRVLVTGGGGWIGSEIACQVADVLTVATRAPRSRRDPPPRRGRVARGQRGDGARRHP